MDTSNVLHQNMCPVNIVWVAYFVFFFKKNDEMDEDLLTRNYFLVNINGQVESCVFPGEDFDFVSCKCLFRNGPDWALVSEPNTSKDNANQSNKPLIFISQTAIKTEDEQQLFVWNLPLEATFQSTNIFGWPQFVGR